MKRLLDLYSDEALKERGWGASPLRGLKKEVEFRKGHGQRDAGFNKTHRAHGVASARN
jgi:hypothetical protein